ncbi:MAG: hypothetical protein WBG46_02935 [Nonlabens sp.]
MKKTILVATLAMMAGAMSHAQLRISDNAIGLRGGGGDGFGTEISYQRFLGGDSNRLEATLGFESGENFDGFKVAGIYQWMWNIEGDFNWYAGPGGGLAVSSYDGRNDDRDDDSESALFVAGQIGIEYNFGVPIVISLDYRPEFYLGNFRDELESTFALGIRYQF